MKVEAVALEMDGYTLSECLSILYKADRLNLLVYDINSQNIYDDDCHSESCTFDRYFYFLFTCCLPGTVVLGL